VRGNVTVLVAKRTAIAVTIAASCAMGAWTAPASAGVPRADVSPNAGGPKTTFRVTFRTPVEAGITGNTRRVYELQAVHSGQCQLSSGWSIVGKSRRNQRVRRTLRRNNGRRWCPGLYTGSVRLYSSCVNPDVGCDDGQPRLVATFRFRIRG
jgi:hypothetical protein